MKTPDLTPAQLVSTILGILGLFVSQGLIDNGTEKIIAGIASVVVPMVWQIADAIIRHGRSNVAAAKAANPVVATETTTGTP